MTRGAWALVLALAAAAEPAPVTNEEVVRLVVAGTPVSRILEVVAERPPAYDLSDDMVEEMRLAGVPEGVLQAMRARQAAATPASPPPDRPLRGRVRLTVLLTPGEALTVPAKASDALAARLRLGAEEDARTVHDLAIFLACVTPEHVPDQWRGKTPLGRDLDATPRHEMLLFRAGDTPAGSRPKLEIPSSLEVDVDDVEAHDLVLGVAARIGDRWRSLALATRDGVQAGNDAPPATGRIASAGAPFAFRVELSPPSERE